MIAAEELVEALALAESTPPGPWRAVPGAFDGNASALTAATPDRDRAEASLIISHLHFRGDAAFYAFLAASRTLVPRLISEVRQLQESASKFDGAFRAATESCARDLGEAREESALLRERLATRAAEIDLLRARLPSCAGKWIAGSGGHRRYDGVCTEVGIWDVGGRYVCDAHKSLHGGDADAWSWQRERDFLHETIGDPAVISVESLLRAEALAASRKAERDEARAELRRLQDLLAQHDNIADIAGRGPCAFVCVECGARMQSAQEFAEYQHSACGGLVVNVTEAIRLMKQQTAERDAAIAVLQTDDVAAVALRSVSAVRRLTKELEVSRAETEHLRAPTQALKQNACTGTLRHDEFTPCPVHDRKR